MPFRDELIAFYANNTIKTLEALPAFQQLCRQYVDDENFRAELQDVADAKAWVESFLNPEGGLTLQKSVSAAIGLLVSVRNKKEKRELCRALIAAGYRPKWSAAQQAYFDDALRKIQCEYDFFLSFTCRYPTVAGDNPINSRYRKFIIAELGSDEFRTSDRKKDNLLALTLHRMLSDESNRGFYFRHKQDDNAETIRKLREACDSSLVFVQLVQPIMFVAPEKENFCFLEWGWMGGNLTQADRETRMLFVVALPNRALFDNLDFYPDYRDWHREISLRNPPYLPEVQDPDLATVRDIRHKIREKLLPHIRDAWSRLRAGVPN